MEDYNDFLTYLTNCTVKIQELLEKVTIMHSEVAVALLETSSLNNPQILIDIAEMAESGKKFDEYIVEGQEMRTQLEKLLDKPPNSLEDYATMMEELKAAEKELEEFKADSFK